MNSIDAVKTQYGKDGKHDFRDVYDHSDASRYVNSLLKLAYRVPDYLARFLPLIEGRRGNKPSPDRLRVIDLCCGYGLNSALLRFGKRENEMMRALENMRSLQPVTDFEIVGLDIAKNALKYGLEHKAFDLVVCSNMEIEDPTRAETEIIAQTDVIISTGSLSYITERTLGRILACIDTNRPLLVGLWPLMGHDCSTIVECLKSFGLEVREDQRLLWHRKFVNVNERNSILSRKNLAGRLVELSNLEEGVYVTSLIGSR